METYLLGIDQGTSSSRAVVFDANANVIGAAQQEYHQHFPQPQWVEQDPHDIWQTTLSSCQKVLNDCGLSGSDITAIGITNQRETTLIWDRKTGEPIYPAIGWQDARTADACQRLIDAGHSDTVREKTGLVLNPYFSASKIQWLLDNVPGARSRAEKGELAFGTVDSFLLWRLTGGQVHRTDATNASRTLLFNLKTQAWDQTLLDLFSIPREILPEVFDSSAHFGETSEDFFSASIPITGMVGDQQAALFGQACFQVGMAKATYGTGAFIMSNIGETPILSENNLLTTVAYRLNGVATFAVEGSIFVAGAAVKWLRDKLKLIPSAAETERLAASANPDETLYFVPSFTGLGAPHWQPNAKAVLSGLSLETEPADIVKALLEGCAYATKDVLNAMQADSNTRINDLHVDGGMAENQWFLQSLADVLGVTVTKPSNTETTVLGAIFLAGLQAGVFSSLEDIRQCWQKEKDFQSQWSDEIREQKYSGWQQVLENMIKVNR
jgi:glycerol kinase